MADFDYDLAIIGSGPGGYVSAIRAAQLGLKTVVIEKGKLGGVCGNIGCIPSKALLNKAELYNEIATLESFGLKIDKSGFDYSKVWQKSRDAAERSGKGVSGLLKKNKVTVVIGTATLSGPKEVSVAGAEGVQKIRARNIMIATGSSPRIIPGFEFDEEQVLSSTGILMMNSLPKSLVILGAGAIGMEFAYVMKAFGVAVTVVEMMDRVLPLEDPDISKIVEADFKKHGVTIKTATKASNLRKDKKGITLALEKDGKTEDLQADKILVAVGRSPNTANLGLEALGVKLDRGFVVTGDYYQTSVAGIFAIGDVVPSPLLAHVASKEGEIAVEFMAGHAGHEKKIDPNEIPGAVYTEPGVGSFGLTEPKAKELGLDYATFSFPYAGIGKASAIEKALGLIKIVYAKKTKEILGAHIVGYSATELIHELLLAKKAELLPEDIATMIHAHPTIGEGIMEAARGIEGWAIHI